MITDNLAIGNRFRHHCLLHQAIEKEPAGNRGSTIKSKRVFVQIVFEMFATCSPLVNPKQPAFQQGRDSMDIGHGDMGRISAIREVRCDVCVSLLRHTVIPAPGIGENRGPGFNVVADKRGSYRKHGSSHTASQF